MKLPRLTIDASGASEPTADLREFVWASPRPDRALYGNVDDTRTLVRTRLLPGATPGASVRWVEHFEVDAVDEDGASLAGARADLVRFDLGPTTFAETGRWRGDDDENLHRRAFSLPRALRLGESLLPVANTRATLDWVGIARLELGEHRAEHRLARLRIEQGGMPMDQWLAEGIGEVAVGRSWGPFARWLLGWSAPGGATLLAPLPADLAGRELPEPDLTLEPVVGRDPV